MITIAITITKAIRITIIITLSKNWFIAAESSLPQVGSMPTILKTTAKGLP